ncbi:MAG: putative diguanylate cyclase YcdT [Pelotomaculum sp. PtaB.Bin013]|uniref:Diguanylate cyclase n=1 Tax=Pelotomaculum isophthalicicum JI TaxID=947010 RepID=A0A9X4H2A9_9FIRM|nr:diguanylate cyclase [Pelotomaculum isophthalicicum]MDF9407158.1 diguanylate cyclase [Pelotomaculum isophthalicicum JI]OPX88689.1 MAG: putative diguanylate cyclase YcdT [Pelotomaculum sp. PtaB.Bin013]
MVDFYVFVILVALFMYVLVVNDITVLYKAYLVFHYLLGMWPFCNFLINVTPDQQLQWVFLSAAFVSLCFLGFGWHIFALVLTGKIKNVKKAYLYLWAVPAVFCSLLVITNPWHFLFAKPSLNGWATRTYGPFFWLFVFSIIIYFIVGGALMIYELATVSEKNKKKQLMLCIWGVVSFLALSITDVLLNAFILPETVVVPGLTSSGLIILAICFVVAIQKYDLFKIVSIAQREVIDSMATGMVIIDKNEVVLDINKSAGRLINLQPGHVFNVGEFYPASGIEFDGEFLEEYGGDKSKILQTEIIINQEQPRHVAMNISPVFDHKKNLLGRSITLNDVTELRGLIEKINENNETLKLQNEELLQFQSKLYKANRKLEQMSITDALTGCYNKRYILNQLDYEIAAARRYSIPFSLMLLDLDKFKLINDTYGHLAGDDVLRGVVDIVNKNLRRSDILARFGGEEFIIYIPHIDHDGAVALANRIRSMLENQTVKTMIGELSVTISIGLISVIKVESINIEEDFLKDLLARADNALADNALYEAKLNGRNCIVAEVFD